MNDAPHLRLSQACNNYCTDVRVNFTTDVSKDKKELITSWKSFAYRSGHRNILLKYSSTLRDGGFFSTIWLICPEKKNWSDIHEKCIVDVSLDKKVALNFESQLNPVSGIRALDPDRIGVGGDLRFQTALIIIIIFYFYIQPDAAYRIVNNLYHDILRSMFFCVWNKTYRLRATFSEHRSGLLE